VNNDIASFERSNITGKFGSNFALSAWLLYKIVQYL
jgi:hypothetical protein